MAGCKVLTRPSRNSATPVTSATSPTGTPAAARVCAEPPVEIRVTPRAAKARATSTIPLLSLTEINARRIGRELAVIAADIGLSRELRQPSRAAGERCQQDGDGRGGCGEGGRSPPGLCRPTAADKHEIGGDYPLDNGSVAEAATYRLLGEMLAMRLPDALAPPQPARQRARRIRPQVEP